jgi:antibiotic biosynthesis monooxygenase (ABM) superfamily enzyme
VIIALSFIDAMNTLLSGPFDTGQLPRIASAPVTVTVSRTIAPGREREFERWSDQMVERARAFPGSLGAGVLHPGPDGGDYQIVFRFVDGLALRLWERSPQRAVLLAQADQFVTGARVHRTVGVEDWFDLPARSEPRRPLWRRILTDVAWVYPVALFLSFFVAPQLARLPFAARTLLSAALITLVMRLAVGPMRSRMRARRRM